ncbi:UPF0721 transmembrane protein y4hK [Formosimonas limnophila]|uniref:Probable membrane transporter protein n=1 Tax=Formosimonas limnophila TaxID=1384487 RepID=A0A8J3CME0_9BURK|nr:sulfite exporter TauE/SafE family protein [Formosimonas limnophila]GHA70207.1 UPF0721 transmembrane protein y4hK [Formosimonas limnophila]
MNDILLPLLLAIAAALYSAVGHGGASGYLAVFALLGLAPASLRPAALALNVAVASLASVQYIRRFGSFPKLLWPLLAGSVPPAFIGGRLPVDATLIKLLIGTTLVTAAVRLLTAHREVTHLREPAAWILFLLGMVLGLLSGLTGIGGGVFLSPIFILMSWALVRESSAVVAPFILANSLSGLIGALSSGAQLPNQFGWWLLAVIIGGFAGSTWGARHGSPLLVNAVLALVLVIAGVKLLLT